MHGTTIDRVYNTILGITVRGTKATVKVTDKKDLGPQMRCKVTDPIKRELHRQHPNHRKMRNGPPKEYRFHIATSMVDSMDEVQLTDWFRGIAENTFPHLLP